MSDATVLGWVIDGLRGGQLYTWHEWQKGRIWLDEAGLRSLEWELFFRALAHRAQPIVNAHYEAIDRLIPADNGDGRVVSAAVISVLEGLELDAYRVIDWSKVPREITEAFADGRIGFDDVLAALGRASAPRR